MEKFLAHFYSTFNPNQPENNFFSQSKFAFNYTLEIKMKSQKFTQNFSPANFIRGCNELCLNSSGRYLRDVKPLRRGLWSEG
jgi:hypothetical protein